MKNVGSMPPFTNIKSGTGAGKQTKADQSETTDKKAFSAMLASQPDTDLKAASSGGNQSVALDESQSDSGQLLAAFQALVGEYSYIGADRKNIPVEKQSSISKETIVRHLVEAENSPITEKQLLQLEALQKELDLNVDKPVSLSGIEVPKELLASAKLLLEQVTKLLPSSKEGSVSNVDSKKLLKLLEEWTSLEKKAGNNNELTSLLKSGELTGGNKKAAAVWMQLTNTYQKRTGLENASKYQEQASVSSTDITKWVKQALARYQTTETETEAKPVFTQSQPSANMTKIEQFTIHVQQTGSQEADDQKLMQEFQRVLASSKFNQVNGNTELLLKLKPANLGEVLVKMVNVDGEMMVKISVASQAAKEVLEGNISQLRHMFSPAQLAIEKQEQNILIHDSYQLETKQEESMGESSAEEETEGETSTSSEGEDESVSFSEFLTAEKEQVS